MNPLLYLFELVNLVVGTGAFFIAGIPAAAWPTTAFCHQLFSVSTLSIGLEANCGKSRVLQFLTVSPNAIAISEKS